MALHIAIAVVFAFVWLQPAAARPRRGVPKPVEHYTFSSERLSDHVDPLLVDYERVIMLNELQTRVTEGRAVCRLGWEGHWVEAVRKGTSSLSIELPLPRGAALDELAVYLIKANGRDGDRVDAPDLTIVGDSLMVIALDDVSDYRVVDLSYSFEGEGVSVDEFFNFQPDVPVLLAEYRFSVSRDLWQAAADAGLTWEFTANTSPSTWDPERADTPDFYSWYWREYDMLPVSAQRIARDPRHVSVSGYLPAPVLAGINPDDLPSVERFDAIRSLEDLLRNNVPDGLVNSPSSSGSVTSSRGASDTLTPIRGK